MDMTKARAPSGTRHEFILIFILRFNFNFNNHQTDRAFKTDEREPAITATDVDAEMQDAAPAKRPRRGRAAKPPTSPGVGESARSRSRSWPQTDTHLGQRGQNLLRLKYPSNPWQKGYGPHDGPDFG